MFNKNYFIVKIIEFMVQLKSTVNFKHENHIGTTKIKKGILIFFDIFIAYQNMNHGEKFKNTFISK